MTNETTEYRSRYLLLYHSGCNSLCSDLTQGKLMIRREITFLPETFDKLKKLSRRLSPDYKHPLTNAQVIEIAIKHLTTEITEGKPNGTDRK
ncbi:MAG: hypothetical protein R3E62_10700 [Pseudomonadales bacterium]